MRMKKTILIALFLCLAGSITSFADEIIVYENNYEGQTPGTSFNEGSPWNWGDNGTVHTCTYQDDGTGNIVVDHTGTIGNPTTSARDMRFGTKWNLTMSGNTSSDPADYIIEFDLRSVSGNWDPIALEFYILTTGGTQGYGSGASDYNQADGRVHVEYNLADLTVGWWQGTNWDLTDSTWSIEVGGPPWPGTSVPAGTPEWEQVWQMDNLKITQISVGTKSSNPDPPNGAPRVDVDAILSWTPGNYADKHDIYLGTDFYDVNDANRTNPMRVLVEQDYDANTYIPNNLQFNTTYYWRIDDVNDPNIYKGSIWSFTTSKEYLVETIIYENDYEGETPGIDFPAWNWVDGTTTHTATFEDDGSGNIVVQHIGTIDNSGGAAASDCRFGSKWDITASGNKSTDPADYTIEFDLRSVSGNWDPINLEFYVLTKETGGDQGYGSGPSAYPQDGWVHVEKNLADLNIGWWEGTNWDITNPSWSIEVGGPPWPGTSVPAGTPEWDQVWIMDNLKITVFVPPTSSDPYPENEAEDVESNPVLIWTPGMYAKKHDVYFGTDFNDVSDANRTNDPCGVLIKQDHDRNYYPSSGTLDLSSDQTYYWRVDDVNGPEIYKGSIWIFTTGKCLAVDNMEYYGDANTPGEFGSRIWYTWHDGLGWTNPAPGQLGNGTGSLVDRAIIPLTRSGVQSLRFDYDNTGLGGKAFYSEISQTFSAPEDWTRKEVKSLTLWFYGGASNSKEPLYVALKDSISATPAIVNYPEDPNELLEARWHEWNIDLRLFDDAGVDLNSVKTMYIGVGERTASQAGGTGTLYIDDIRLYQARCVPSIAKPQYDLSGNCVVDYDDIVILADQWLDSGLLVTPVAVGTANLVGHWEMDDGSGYLVSDSTVNANDGAIWGNLLWIGRDSGSALWFPGELENYVDIPTLGSLIGSLTKSTFAIWANFSNAGGGWQRIFDFGNDDQVYMFLTPRTGTNGPMRFAITTGSSGGEIGAESPDTLPSGWHHVAVTISDPNTVGTRTIRLYLDGAQVGVNTQSTLSPQDLGNTYNNWLGRSQWEADAYYTGRLDDFRIYNRNLSASEVASLADKTSPFSIEQDLNQDGKIDLKDYAELASIWLEEQLWPEL